MSTEMLKPPEFRQSREAQIISELFRDIEQKDGGLITWRELCSATGKGRAELKSPIQTAIRRMRKDHGLVIENDRDLGYRLKANNRLVGSGRTALERSRRIEKVGLEKMDCCELAKLSMEEKAEHMVVKSAIQLGLMTKRSRVRSSLTQMVIRKHNALTEQEMLQAIVERLGQK
jgi:biotin operon repressor